MRFVIALALLAACHSHDHDAYATFQACFDQHTNVETLPVNQAIVVCCLDHPIDGNAEVCGETAAECVTYLTANLSMDSATQAQISAACDEYIVQKGQ